MKRTVSPSSPGFDSRLWTCSDEARALLKKTPEALDGVLLLHARVADTVTKANGDDEDRVRRFRISTESRDRHGDIVRSRGISLKNFRKNPVVLFAHDSRNPPIGRSPKVQIGDGVVDADVDFFDRETFEFADTIFRIVSVGGLKATSIGFIPLKFERIDSEDPNDFGIDFKKSELLEFSIVPIPANPEAVRSVAKSGAAMKPYLEWLDDLQDNQKEVESVLSEFGIDDDALMEVRKAANGDRILVPGVGSIKATDEFEINWDSILETKSEESEEVQDEEQVGKDEEHEVDEKDISDGIEELTVKAEELEDGETAVLLVGEFPKETKISSKLLGLGPCRREGDEVIVDLDDYTATYKIDSEEGSILTCSLVVMEAKSPITFGQAHADGTPAQPRDAAWNASREVRDASVEDLFVMSAWRESKPRDELVKGDFKFPHHKAGGQHAVNFRALSAGVAVLNGARGGANIPDGDRRGVWNHLARHFRQDFDEQPPELRWFEIEPLKNHSEYFFFDYSSAQLLVRLMTEEDGPIMVDARSVEMNDGSVSVGEHDKEWTFHSVAGRKSKWSSQEEFLQWAAEEGFDVDHVKETRNFWRLAQDSEALADTVTISLYPNDVEPGSPECLVQATLVPVKKGEVKTEEKADGVPVYDPRVSNFALTVDGVKRGVPDEDLEKAEELAPWALMIVGVSSVQGIPIESDSTEEADRVVRGMVSAFGKRTLYLGSLIGQGEDGPVYSDYAMYQRDLNGAIQRTALCDDAIDVVQDFLDGIERLSSRELSDQDRARLEEAKGRLEELLRSDEEEEDEHPLAFLLNGGSDGSSDEVFGFLKEVFREVGQQAAQEELKKLTGEVD